MVQVGLVIEVGVADEVGHVTARSSRTEDPSQVMVDFGGCINRAACTVGLCTRAQ